jgi:hypothetical protein
MVLALQQAKRLAQAQIRAKGLKLTQFSAKEITLLAEAELERNRARFIAVAEQTINTWPGLARTDEGRRRAQQRGVKFGRKPVLTSHQRQEALARRAASLFFRPQGCHASAAKQ